MEILYINDEFFKYPEGAQGGYIYTVGNFDGLHQGHVSVLNKLVEVSKKSKEKSGVVTFASHPFLKKENFKVLSCNSEKIEYFRKIGIDRVVFFEFEQIRNMDYKEFIELLKNKFALSALVLGEGSHLGKSKSGDIKRFSEIARIHAVKHIVSLEGKISSTAIREHIKKGEIEEANELLGRCYSVTGKRIFGKKIASELGFPTVNVSPCQDDKMVPANGVYAVEFSCSGEKFLAACNVGVKPTFSIDTVQAPVIEVHTIDVDNLHVEDGQEVEVAFIKKIRDEAKFEVKDDLIKQIKTDIKNIKETYGGKRDESYQRRKTAGHKRVCC